VIADLSGSQPRYRLWFDDTLITEKHLAFDVNNRQYDGIMFGVDVPEGMHTVHFQLMTTTHNIIIKELIVNDESKWVNQHRERLTLNEWKYNFKI